ncbi:MAG: hypothetical protein CMN78_06225 [Spirochaetales bacterium]|nr:hypothetical protein [Spirochaetales bacterium]
MRRDAKVKYIHPRLRIILAAMLLILAFAGPAYADTIDFVVLLDVSESMFSFFDDTVNFLIRAIVEEHLQKDDGFHLVSFANSPDVELSRVIATQEDIDAVLNRILLLHPLGKYTDLVSALKYLYSFIETLRPDSSKKILILTDGIHDPPPGSPYPATDVELRSVLEKTATQIRDEGWDVGVLQFPDGREEAPAGPAAPGPARTGPAAPGRPEDGRVNDDHIGGAEAAPVADQREHSAQAQASVDVAAIDEDTSESSQEGEPETAQSQLVDGADAAVFVDQADERPAGDTTQTLENIGLSGDDVAVAAQRPASSDSPQSEQLNGRRTQPGARVQDDLEASQTTPDQITDSRESEAAAETAKDGVTKLPADQEPQQDEPERPNLIGELANDSNAEIHQYRELDNDFVRAVTGAPRLIFPKELGNVDFKFALSLAIENSSADVVNLRLTGILWNGSNILRRTVSTKIDPSTTKSFRALVALPKTTVPGRLVLELEAVFAGDIRVFPKKGSTEIILNAPGQKNQVLNPNVLAITGYVVIGIMGLALVVVLIVGVRRLVGRQIFATGGSPGLQHQRAFVAGPAIEMRVEGQNPHIGMRNIHVIRDGTTRTIGGGMSNFLIYLYQLPGHVGEIKRSGDIYSYMPVKLQFCRNPERLENCLDNDIVLISDGGRQIIIRFSRYISELEKVNRIMHLTDRPGVPTKP